MLAGAVNDMEQKAFPDACLSLALLTATFWQAERASSSVHTACMSCHCLNGELQSPAAQWAQVSALRGAAACTTGSAVPSGYPGSGPGFAAKKGPLPPRAPLSHRMYMSYGTLLT